MRVRAQALFLALALVGGSTPVLAGFVYSEAADGELSSDRFNPTVLTAMTGANVLSGTVGTDPDTGIRDLDYYTVVIPVGLQLDSLFQTSYDGDGRSFIAFQAGSTFTLPPSTTNVSAMLGYLHFGEISVDADLLPLMASQSGVIGYTAPLPSGSYTFWMQETGLQTAKYTLTFNVSEAVTPVPEPSALCLAAAGILGAAGAGRRWRALRG